MKIGTIVCLSFVSLSAAAGADSRTIATIAGNNFAFPNTPLPAIAAPLGSVAGVAVDAKGNLYLSDPVNVVVFKVDPMGVLTVFAGNGVSATSGDGGPATSASLAAPGALAVDAAGNVFIVDRGHMRQVSPSGIITTVTGLTPQSSIATDAAGNVYASNSDGSVQKWTPGAGVSTVLAPFTLFANAIAVDAAGAIYATVGSAPNSNSTDGLLYKVTPGGAPTTIAHGLYYPKGLQVDASGNVYVAEYASGQSSSNRIVKVAPDGTVTTVAGVGLAPLNGVPGSASQASIAPIDVALDNAGNIFAADSFNARAYKVAGSAISVVAGNGAYKFGGDGGLATLADLNSPSGVAIDARGNLIVADTGNHRVRSITPNGIITTIAGNGIADFRGDGGPAPAASLNSPSGVAADSAGNLYIVDAGNNRVRRVSPGGVISTIAGNGDTVFVGTLGGYELAPGYSSITYSGDGGAATSTPLTFPRGVTLDAAGNLYISELFRIRKVTPDGKIATVAGNGPGSCPPTPFSAYCGVYGGDGGPATSAFLDSPNGVAVDSQGDVIIADSGNGRVRQVNAAGQMSTLVQTDSKTFDPHIPMIIRDDPLGVTVDSSGTIYYSDVYNQNADLFNNQLPTAAKIAILALGDAPVTIAGGLAEGYSGDGGPATGAALYSPIGLALDASGNLYFADSANQRIRVVLAQTPVLEDPSAGQPIVISSLSGARPAMRSLPVHTSGLPYSPGLAFSAAVTGAVWLSASAANGVLTLTADPSSLPEGSYSATVTLTPANNAAAPIALQVVFHVIDRRRR